VRTTVTIPTKLLTWICTIASTVLELFIIWLGPRQASSAIVLVLIVYLLPGTELSISIPNIVGAEAGLTTVEFIVVLILDLAVEAVRNS
jgi:hypothetical protein